MRRIEPNPGPQTRALASGADEVGYGGARGGGKSFALTLRAMRPATTGGSGRGFERYRGLILRKTYKDLRDWIGAAKPIYSPTGGKWSGSEDAFVWPVGAMIRCGHLGSDDAYESYQGHEYQFIGIEELTQIPDEDRFLKILGSCRSTIPGLRPRVFTTFNPGGPGHSWVRKRYVDPAPPGHVFFDAEGNSRVFFRALLEDNPVLMKADPRYERWLMSLPEATRRAWRFGDWDAFEGQYFPEFSRAKHVVQALTPPKHWRRYRSIDWGYRPDPWVCLWFAVGEDGREVCYREAQGNSMTPEEVARKILDLSEHDGTFAGNHADPSMWSKHDGASTAEKMGLVGLHLEPADNTRVQGWMRVHEYLAGPPWLTIAENCVNLIRCIPALIHDEKKPEDAAASPDDHHPDALRYHLMMRPSRAAPEPKLAKWNTRGTFEALAKGVQGK